MKGILYILLAASILITEACAPSATSPAPDRQNAECPLKIDDTIPFVDLERCCNRERGDACSAAGAALLRGQGVAADSQKSLSYFNRACDLNHWIACDILGTTYSAGLHGAKKDTNQAVEFYTRACRGGERLGCMGAASVLMSSANPSHDYERAFRFASEGQSVELASSSLQNIVDDCVSQIDKITEARERERAIEVCFNRFDDHVATLRSIRDPDADADARKTFIDLALGRCESFGTLAMPQKRLPKACEGVAKSKTVP